MDCEGLNPEILLLGQPYFLFLFGYTFIFSAVNVGDNMPTESEFQKYNFFDYFLTGKAAVCIPESSKQPGFLQ